MNNNIKSAVTSICNQVKEFIKPKLQNICNAVKKYFLSPQKKAGGAIILLIVIVSILLLTSGNDEQLPKDEPILTGEDFEKVFLQLKKETNPQILEENAISNDQRIRAIVAQNINTPTSALEILANDEEWVVRNYLGSNKGSNISPEILTKLSKDQHTSVRWAVAINPNTPEDTLITFLTDESAVQEYMVRNKGISEPFMATIAMKSTEVRALELLAKREDISERVITILYRRNIPSIINILKNKYPELIASFEAIKEEGTEMESTETPS